MTTNWHLRDELFKIVTPDDGPDALIGMAIMLAGAKIQKAIEELTAAVKEQSSADQR